MEYIIFKPVASVWKSQEFGQNLRLSIDTCTTPKNANNEQKMEYSCMRFINCLSIIIDQSINRVGQREDLPQNSLYRVYYSQKRNLQKEYYLFIFTCKQKFTYSQIKTKKRVYLESR